MPIRVKKDNVFYCPNFNGIGSSQTKREKSINVRSLKLLSGSRDTGLEFKETTPLKFPMCILLTTLILTFPKENKHQFHSHVYNKASSQSHSMQSPSRSDSKVYCVYTVYSYNNQQYLVEWHAKWLLSQPPCLQRTKQVTAKFCTPLVENSI